MVSSDINIKKINSVCYGIRGVKVSIIFFVLIFGLVVISHELGHFMLAKANGIHVVEFAIGMGPTLFAFTKRDTKYSIKLLPIGGACMFEGEDGLETEKGEISKGSFLHANVWARISSVLAGPIFNFILAFIIALIMVNMMAIVEPIVAQVVEDSPAQTAGLEAGDRIVKLDGEKMFLFQDIFFFNNVTDGKEFPVVYERNGETYTTTLTPTYNEETGMYNMGIYGGVLNKETGLGRLKFAYYQIRYSVKTTYKSLGMLVTGKVGRKDIAGPVGIVNMVDKTYESTKEAGWENVVLNMLNITLLLSVNLGILNLLPVPALDGGRLVFLLLEVVRGKPIPIEKESIVHFIGFVFFMILMVFVFFNDLVNIFG